MSTFLIERPDWQLFTVAATLSQKAGVAPELLRRLVIKELVDNALDAGASAEVIQLDDDTFTVTDSGDGFEPDELSRLFAVDRNLVSSKLWRKPTRGALGNGLRVVSGGVIASGGQLEIATRGTVYSVRPLIDGGCDVVGICRAEDDRTAITIKFGDGLPPDPNAGAWGRLAIRMSMGKTYSGRASAWHHDCDSLFTLLRGSGDRSVREFVTHFDGCTGAKAGEIAQPWIGKPCASLNRDDTLNLLRRMRQNSVEVTAGRLGAVGEDADLGAFYAKVEGVAVFGDGEDAAKSAYVAEVWAEPAKDGRSSMRACINRTPAPVDVAIYRQTSDKVLVIHGCNLGYRIPNVPKTGAWDFVLNITAPYVPIVSDGKSPDLNPFRHGIIEAITKAARKARGVRAATGEKISKKDVLRENIDAIVEQASDGGRFRPSVRDLFYKARPFYLDADMEPPDYNYFSAMITDYENDFGEIEGLYREERGAITHPHGRGTVPLSTQDVEVYERPPWLFGTIVVIEKGGLVEAVTSDGLQNRLDCAFMTSRGFTTRAVKDLLDSLEEHDEPLKVFSVSDADAHGTTIFQTLVEETAARGARKVEVINLGLFPWEAQEMGLAAESFTSKGVRPVADFVRDYDDRNDTDWTDWLQSNRYELNAMGLPEFIAWLEGKLIENGVKKVAPPADVVAQEFDAGLAAAVRRQLTEKILREAGLDAQVASRVAEIKGVAGGAGGGVSRAEMISWLTENDDEQWRGYVAEKIEEAVADEQE